MYTYGGDPLYHAIVSKMIFHLNIMVGIPCYIYFDF